MTKELKTTPSNWVFMKLKYLTQISNGATPSTSEETFWNGDILWATPVDVSKSLLLIDTERKITKEGFNSCGTTMVPKGSVVLTTRAPIGNLSIAGKELCTNQGCKCLVPKLVEGKFLYYLLLTHKELLQVLGQGTTFQELSNENLANIKLYFPSQEEQKIIALYLDAKSIEIENIISKKEMLIDRLKQERIEIINHAVTKGFNDKTELKPSGIDWIKEIPKSWTTKRIKYIATTFGRIGYRGYQTSDLVNEGEGAITLSPSNMKDLEMDYTKCTYLSWAKYDESPEIQIENGDVIFVKTGSTFGKTALVNNLPEKATINPQLLVFKNIKISNYFFYFVLLSELIRGQVNTSVIGGTIPTISQEKIGNYYLFVPPVEEQKEIVAAVRKHLDRIKTAIATITQEIELIKEYKAALINEVVTGKIILN